MRGKGLKTYRQETENELKHFEEEKIWQKKIDAIKPLLPSQRLKSPDFRAPARKLGELIDRVSRECSIGQAVAERLIEEVTMLRNLCCPRSYSLKSGEMPLLATHVRAHLSKEIATEFRRQAPVIVTVLRKEESSSLPDSVPEYLKQFKERIIRVCFQAYRQNGLLTLAEMQWIFKISSSASRS